MWRSWRHMPAKPHRWQTRGDHRLATSEAGAAELGGVALPVLGDLDEQVEVDLLAQHRLDLLAGAGADVLEARAGAADDDRLLRRALDEDLGADGEDLARGDLLDDHGEGVGQLVAHALERGLADELGDERVLGLVGELALGV